jgi:hypothetical protein
MAGESRKVEDAWLEDHQRSLHLRRINLHHVCMFVPQRRCYTLFSPLGTPTEDFTPKHAVQGTMGDLCLIIVIVRTT